MNTKVRLVILIFSFLASTQNVFAEIQLSKALAKDVGQAYGFYLGQGHSLKVISKKYPTISGLALIAYSHDADRSITSMLITDSAFL
jgi:hypothetical protein